MGSENVECFFQCSIKMCVFDVLYRLVTYLWTKRFKCCIKSANYAMLTYVWLSILWDCLMDALVMFHCIFIYLINFRLIFFNFTCFGPLGCILLVCFYTYTSLLMHHPMLYLTFPNYLHVRLNKLFP